MFQCFLRKKLQKRRKNKIEKSRKENPINNREEYKRVWVDGSTLAFQMGDCYFSYLELFDNGTGIASKIPGVLIRVPQENCFLL